MLFPQGSSWRLNRDRKMDNAQSLDLVHHIMVDQEEDQGTRFVARYSDTADDSLFRGEVHARETTLIMIMQNNPATQYWAVHAGRGNGVDFYEGVWYDVHGNRGDFTLLPG